MLVSRQDDHILNIEVSNVADIERGVLSPTYGSSRTAEIERIVQSARTQQRTLNRVPQQMRDKHKHLFGPSVVSLGPYHHGQPQFHQMEENKIKILDIMFGSSDRAKDNAVRFRGIVLQQVKEIRRFYGGLPEEEYSDDKLADMMLRDSCFVVCCMQMLTRNLAKLSDVTKLVGVLEFMSVRKDCIKLENQIPWWVIKMLILFRYNSDDGKVDWGELIREFLSLEIFGDKDMLKQVPWEEGTDKEPLHLLEALHNTFLKEETPPPATQNSTTDSSQKRMYTLLDRRCRSVMELKAKGIHFRPSSDYLNDIRFSSHSFYGVLHLPVLIVDRATITYFSNIIALEISTANLDSKFPVISYVNFMRSLIDDPKDVEVLQDKGIIVGYLQDSEQIVRIFKEIDTHGVDNMYNFEDIRLRINDHCNSKAKTWIADLINNYFRTPWTAVALIAATFLLCLTFLQTYYTMHTGTVAIID